MLGSERAFDVNFFTEDCIVGRRIDRTRHVARNVVIHVKCSNGYRYGIFFSLRETKLYLRKLFRYQALEIYRVNGSISFVKCPRSVNTKFAVNWEILSRFLYCESNSRSWDHLTFSRKSRISNFPRLIHRQPESISVESTISSSRVESFLS